MAAVAAELAVTPLLALAWYDHTPLPNAPPPEPVVLGPTELSQRLLSAFDEGLHCDIAFQAGPEDPPILAHRIVLRRNPALGLDAVSACSEEPPVVTLPAGVPSSLVRLVVRAHYEEAEEAAGAASSASRAQGQLRQMQSRASQAQWENLEAAFGPLDASSWLPLHAAVATERFADCALRLPCGTQVAAHCAIVAGTEDGHFFTAALRWPGGPGSGSRVVAVPQGLSQEALKALLRMRYGCRDSEVEHILEVRHFAELFDWSDVQRRCEAYLEALLTGASSTMDAESVLAVVAHAEECTLPAHLKAAALAAAVRQWSKVTEAAAGTLTARRCAELRVLHRVRTRDGHVCPNLEEYLHAAEDDLAEWERGLALDAPLTVRRQVQRAWDHWQQILFEYGHLVGAAAAERWRAKAVARREQLREERAQQRSATMKLPAGRIWFEASFDWLEVPQNAICPAGLEIRCDMQTGRNFARFPL